MGVSSNEQAQICVSANEVAGRGRERWEGKAAALGAPSISGLGSSEKLLQQLLPRGNFNWPPYARYVALCAGYFGVS